MEERRSLKERNKETWKQMKPLSKAGFITGCLSPALPILSAVAIPICLAVLFKAKRDTAYETGKGFIYWGLGLALALPVVILIALLVLQIV